MKGLQENKMCCQGANLYQYIMQAMLFKVKSSKKQ